MTDAYAHHVGAKLASDKALEMWRNNSWSNDVVSEKVISSRSSSKFPSPDATFFDEVHQRKITFEFKPFSILNLLAASTAPFAAYI